MDAGPRSLVLVTGATGYIGGRLVPRLLSAGYRVRCLARDPRKLEDRPWASDEHVELVRGDASNEADLARAIAGCRFGFYLIHSMIAAGPAYRDHDRNLAAMFARVAEAGELERIIYLGGLGETGCGLSEHLASRREVENALASGSVPVTVFRAAMIIGSGSASFEILRYLVERLPIMVTPKWVGTQCQPIAVRNVLHYLVQCLDTPETVGRTFDIGGSDIMTYREIMQVVAEAIGLRRRIIMPVPVLTPRLSSLWIHLITPVSHRIARPLADGLKNRVVCRSDEAAKLMPQPLLSIRESVVAATDKWRQHDVETTWCDAGPIPGDPDWAGGKVFMDRREVEVPASPAAVFKAVCRIGGNNGYYSADWLWRIRGWMDRCLGGPGLRRGRRDPEDLRYGEALDFWRVHAIKPERYLELRAEMKLPGEARLAFEILPVGESDERSRVVQTARFKPRGLAGLAYWYAVVPLHGIVFKGMLRGISEAACRIAPADSRERPGSVREPRTTCG